MFDFSPIAASHGIDTADLTKFLAGRGYDFSAFAGDDADRAFIERTGNAYAAQIAAAKAKIEARRAALRPVLTAEAVANPDAQCGRCNGHGRIRGFSHVDGGRCFACSGKGIRRAR